MIPWKIGISALLVVFLSCITFVKGIDRLKSYSLLRVEDVEGFVLQRYKRSVNQRNTKAIQDLKFNLFDRRFNLKLAANRDIYSPDFKTIFIKEDGSHVEVGGGIQKIYKGVVAGEPSSDVYLHLQDDSSSVFVAKIVTESETYYIEPAQGHKIVTTTEIQDTMLAYKASDFTYEDENGHSLTADIRAAYPKVQISQHHNQSNTQDDHFSERSKRATDDLLNTCSLNLYADYKFYQLHYNAVEGDKENREEVAVQRTKYYMIDLITRIDGIYRRTSFQSGSNELKNYGLSIRRVYIHGKPSTNEEHYNYPRDTIQKIPANARNTAVDRLLDAFGVRTYRPHGDDKPCLSHLFTAYSFSNGVLGLAYIASPNYNAYGGVCSNSYYNSTLGSNIDLNTGWSTAVNKERKKILTQQAEIVLAHEIGHNFGSEHDPANEQCSPGGVKGNFIMHTYAGSGFDTNNRFFSPCSKSSIGQVIINKKSKCFEEKKTVLTDNYKRDSGEECDEGPGGGTCCDSSNKYKNGGDCSTVNDQCCQFKDGKCTYQGVMDVCQEAPSDDAASCLTESRCSGTSRNCTLTYKSYRSKCQNGYGRCTTLSVSQTATVCQPFLKSIGLTPCTCTESDNQCVECYMRDGRCLPFDRNDVPDLSSENQQIYNDYIQSTDLKWNDVNHLKSLPNTPCAGGLCMINKDTNKLSCEKIDTDLVARFWNFLSELDVDAVVEFMRDNIVGTILVFSLILWLPCVIAVFCVDRKRRKEEKLMDQAISSIRLPDHAESNFGLRPIN